MSLWSERLDQKGVRMAEVFAVIAVGVAAWLWYSSRVQAEMRTAMLQGFFDAWADFDEESDEQELRRYGGTALNRAAGFRLLDRKPMAWGLEGRALGAMMRANEVRDGTTLQPNAAEAVTMHRAISLAMAEKQALVLQSAREQAGAAGQDFNAVLRAMATRLAETGSI